MAEGNINYEEFDDDENKRNSVWGKEAYQIIDEMVFDKFQNDLEILKAEEEERILEEEEENQRRISRRASETDQGVLRKSKDIPGGRSSQLNSPEVPASSSSPLISPVFSSSPSPQAKIISAEWHASTDIMEDYDSFKAKKAKRLLRKQHGQITDQEMREEEEKDLEDEKRSFIFAEPEVNDSTYSQKANTNFIWSMFNLWNDVLGPGIVSLPLYASQMGVPATIVVFIVVGFFNFYTLNSLFYMARKFRKRTLAELTGFGLGVPGYLLVCFFIFVFNFGGFVGGYSKMIISFFCFLFQHS